MTTFWNLFRRRPSPNACPVCGHPAHPDRACGHTIKRREFDGRREYVCACGR
jgi:hypothetical protein